MFYRADRSAVCADVIPFYENGEFKLFYLKDFRDRETFGEGCPWNLLTTKDLVNYVDHGAVLERGTQDEQDLYVFTGSCTKWNNEYYIFYTGHNPHLRAKGLREQKILLAKSVDMLHWTKVRDFVFEAPEWLEMHDFRDPFVYFDEDRQQFCMLIAGRLKNDMPINNRGCTLVAYSTDMRHWELSKEPFYAPNAYFTHECPDLFKMGDWWYLVFSEFTDKILTTYRMSKSINGPWITPKINSFDGHCFYAAKSVSDGKRRIMFGWNCIKDKEKDLNFWQWGGNIIAHEIVQNEDGTLYVKCPTEVKNNYHKDFPLSVGKSFGKVIQDCDKMILGQNGEKSVQIFNAMPQNCKIEFDFVTTDDIGDFGLLLRETSNMDNYYEVRFEPMYNRLAFDRWPRRDGTEHTLVDCERFCPIEVGTTNSVIVLAQGSVLEVYVNNKVAMSTRMFDFTEGNFGFCVNNTQVIFSNIKISE